MASGAHSPTTAMPAQAAPAALATVAAGGAALLLPPPRPSTRPPLPRRPPAARAPAASASAGPARRRKQTHVDLDRALVEFADCVSRDLAALNSRFVDEGDVCFAAWKRLWGDARMSAAFHVEFWNSSATTTHKAILQRSLDALLQCIESNERTFSEPKSTAQLFGFVFGLYCAYSVQLGVPKHKIDIVPSGWARLSAVEVVARGSGAHLFPLAAKEVRAIMHKLAVTENAFLKCLRGFSHIHQLGSRSQTLSEVASSSSQTEAAETPHRVEEHKVTVSHLEAVQVLSTRYNEVMELVNNSTDSASRVTRRAGSGRDLPRGIAQLSMSQPTAEHEHATKLFDGLRSYLAARAAGPDQNLLFIAEEQEMGSPIEATFDQDRISESSYGSNNLRDLEEGLLHAVGNSRASQNLEEAEQVEKPKTSSGITPDRPKRGRQLSVGSQLSSLASVTSDGLDELEAELMQSVNESVVTTVAPPASTTRESIGTLATTTPHARSASGYSTQKPNSQQTLRKPKKPSASVPAIAPSRLSAAQNNSGSLTAAATDGSVGPNIDEVAEMNGAPASKTKRRYSIDSVLSSLASASSDGLDELEAELMENVRRGVEILAESDKAQANRSKPAPKGLPKQASGTVARPSGATKGRAKAPTKATKAKTAAKPKPQTRTLVSPSADRIAPLPLDHQVKATTNTRTLRRRAPSIAESDGLSELEAELSQGIAQQATSVTDRNVAANEINVAGAGQQLATKSSTSKSTAKRKRATRNTSSSNVVGWSRAPSIAESDGLSELEAELSQNVLNQATVSTKNVISEAPKPPTTAKKKRVAKSLTRGPNVSALVSSTALVEATSTITPQDHQEKMSISARLRSRAPSVAESDGLSELEAELSQKVADEVTALAAAPANLAPKVKATRGPRKSPAPPKPKRARTQVESFGDEIPQISPRQVRRRTTQSAKAVRAVQTLPVSSTWGEVTTGFSSRSTARNRAPSVAESDGLSELEAELSQNVLYQAVASTNPPTTTKQKVAAKANARSASVSAVMAAPGLEATTTASQLFRQGNTAISTRLRSRASSIADSDGLSELEAELSQSVLDPAAALTSLRSSVRGAGPKLKASKRPTAGVSKKRAPKTQTREFGVSALVSTPGAAKRTTTDTLALPSQLPSGTRELPSRAPSVAESDGLSELEAELSQDVRTE